MTNLLLVLLLVPVAHTATLDAAPALGAPRPAQSRSAARPVLPPSPPRARLLHSPAEMRRLRADLSGRVKTRVESRAAGIRARLRGAAARRELSALRASLRVEELELRRDRARAFDEYVSAPRGSAERKAWWTAVSVGTVMLEDYAAAYAALDAGARL